MVDFPFSVVVVDEFNDLIMQCSAEANDAIVRLAQKARAEHCIIKSLNSSTTTTINGRFSI